MSKRGPLIQFGREVRRRREVLRLSIEQLAERAGLTSNYVGTIELGLRDPSLSTILAIANGLDIAPGELFGAVPVVSPAGFAMGKRFEMATPGVRDGILTILRAVDDLGLTDLPPPTPRGSG